METIRIKKPITEKEYKLLINHTKGDDSLKEFNQKRFLMIFWLLYYSGVRINVLSQLKYKHIKEIIQIVKLLLLPTKPKMKESSILVTRLQKRLRNILIYLKMKTTM